MGGKSLMNKQETLLHSIFHMYGIKTKEQLLARVKELEEELTVEEVKMVAERLKGLIAS